jgi:hypothetical protein
MINPHKNPLDKKSGDTTTLLASLTREELQECVAWYRWRQANESFPDKAQNVYKSSGYFMYRTNQFIYDAQKLLKKSQDTEF